MARSWFLPILLLAFGCAGTPATVDLEAERLTLMSADEALFRSHEDTDEFLTFLADDAVFMPADAPAARGEAIRETWDQLLSLPGFHLEWQASSQFL